MVTQSPGRTCRGFTLVELLVVIGIIAVLISILLPSLAKAKAAAEKVACLSNLRQLGTGLAQYANQYDSWTLPAGTSGVDQWHDNEAFRMNMGEKADPSRSWPLALNCPTSVKLRPIAGTNGRAGIGGTYGMNKEQTRRPQYAPHNVKWIKAGQVRRPSEKLYMADSFSWELTMVDAGNYVNEVTPSGTSKYGAAAYRHGQQVPVAAQEANVLFYDFHAETRPRGDITGNRDNIWMYWK